LAALFAARGWSFAGIDNTTLAKDAEAQRSERADHDALEASYRNAHEAFGVAQEKRHERYAAALNAPRGAFRADKAIQAERARFTRRRRSAAKPSGEAPPNA